MLAGHLGMSVRQAQSEIDSAEFSEWMAHHTTHPFRAEKSEYQLAIIATILANVHRQKGTKEYKPEDFIPEYGHNRQDTAESIELKLRAMFNGNN